MWCRYFDNDFLKQKNTHIRSGNHHESNQCAPDTPRIVFVLNARGTLKPSFNMIFAILSLSPGLFVSLYPGCCLCLSPWLCLALLSLSSSFARSVVFWLCLPLSFTPSSSFTRFILFYLPVFGFCLFFCSLNLFPLHLLSTVILNLRIALWVSSWFFLIS